MTKNMTEGKPAKLILMFALPLIIGNIFQQFYSLVDTLIVGRTIGVNALAALGCTGSLNFFVLGFIMGFANGLAILTAQRFGAENTEGVKRSFAASILLSIGMSVIITILALLLVRPAMELLQTPEEIMEDAVAYIQIIFAGLAASVFFNLTSNMIRALGDSRTPLVFLILACCVNIVLDLVFITVFHMGVEGAAYATIISQVLSGIWCFRYIRKKMPDLWVEKRHFMAFAKEAKEHIVLGLPMGFQMSIIAIGSLTLQFALNSLGATSVAAVTAAQKIDSIATMPLNSLGAAMATYSAQNYGAQRLDRIRTGVFQCALISVGISILMGAVNFFAGDELTAIFVGKGETEVLSLAKIYLCINGTLYWVLALLFVYRFTLQGLGDSVTPTIAGVMELLMRAGAALFLVGPFGFTGAVAANPLAWIGACIPLGFAYYRLMNRLEHPDRAKKCLWKRKNCHVGEK